MGLFSNSNKCQVCGDKNCSNVQHAFANSGSSSSSGVRDTARDRRVTERGARADAAYAADKKRQDDEGKAHLVRHLSAKDVRNGVLKEMIDAGAVDKSEHDGSDMKVVLKKKFKDRWRKYEA